MTALIFVDTNILLYCFDSSDLAKQSRAQQWVRRCWQQRNGRLSAQVLNELYSNAMTKFKRSVGREQARSEVIRLRLWQPPSAEGYTVDEAWRLQGRYSFSYWDALIVSSAIQQGCRYLLSEDMQHQQMFDSVQIVNPLLPESDQFLTSL